jgi:hypothetical protein
MRARLLLRCRKLRRQRAAATVESPCAHVVLTRRVTAAEYASVWRGPFATYMLRHGRIAPAQAPDPRPAPGPGG